MNAEYKVNRVLVVASKFRKSYGGWASHLDTLLPVLAKRGFRLCLITSRGERGDHDDPKGSIRVIEVPPAWRWGRYWSFINGSFLFLFASVLIRRFDCIYIPNFYFPASLLMGLGLCFRKPVVVRVAGAELRDVGLEASLRRFLLRFTHTVVTLNGDTLSELEKMKVSLRRIALVPNGVDVAAFSPHFSLDSAEKGLLRALTPAGFVVLLVGSVCPRKGVHVLVTAVEHLLAVRPDVHLVIVGPYDDKPEKMQYARFLKKVLRESPVREKTLFTGMVKDVRPFLSAADVFVLPSFREGMPNALLEAMACGLPCVASDIAGISEIINPGENGLLVPPGDAKALARALRLLSEDRALGEKLGAAARHYVLENLTVERMAERYARIFFS